MYYVRYCAALAALAGLMSVPIPARAAESYDNCTGFIDSLPATISTQGTWCLRKDLATSMSYGNAIDVAANNVTIDCNDFKVGGLAAGAGTTTYGIFSIKLNLTVRNCNIRGFGIGVALMGDAGGHVVEDNRFDGNTSIALYVEGDGSVVQRNLVHDTGGSTAWPGWSVGIRAHGNADVIDNTVSGVWPGPHASGNGASVGVLTAFNFGGSVRNNRIRGLVSVGTGDTGGIDNDASGAMSIRGNTVIGNGSNGSGVTCGNSTAVAKRNIVSGFGTGILSCTDDGTNVAL